MLKELAKHLAVLSFLQNGRSSTTTMVSVPFLVWLRLLPYLGYTGSVRLPSVENINGEDIGEEEADVYFGGLNGLSLSITTNGKAISVNCTVSMTQIHSLEDQTNYANTNPLYPHQLDKQEGAAELLSKL